MVSKGGEQMRVERDQGQVMKKVFSLAREVRGLVPHMEVGLGKREASLFSEARAGRGSRKQPPQL